MVIKNLFVLFLSVFLFLTNEESRASAQTANVWKKLDGPIGSERLTSYRHVPCTITLLSKGTGVDIVLYYPKSTRGAEDIIQYTRIWAENTGGRVKVYKSHSRVDPTMNLNDHKEFFSMKDRDDRFMKLCGEAAKNLPDEVKKAFWGEYGLVPKLKQKK